MSSNSRITRRVVLHINICCSQLVQARNPLETNRTTVLYCTSIPCRRNIVWILDGVEATAEEVAMRTASSHVNSWVAPMARVAQGFLPSKQSRIRGQSQGFAAGGHASSGWLEGFACAPGPASEARCSQTGFARRHATRAVLAWPRWGMRFHRDAWFAECLPSTI